MDPIQPDSASAEPGHPLTPDGSPADEPGRPADAAPPPVTAPSPFGAPPFIPPPAPPAAAPVPPWASSPSLGPLPGSWPGISPVGPGGSPGPGGSLGPSLDAPAGGPWRVVEPRRPRIGLSIALIVVLALAFFAGLATDRAMVEVTPVPTTPTGIGLGPSEPPEFKTLWDAYNVLKLHYVDQSALDPTKLAYGATQGLVNAVGDTGHTRFLTPDEVAASHQDLSGSISGIGARMSQVGTDFVVQSVVPRSPAEKAGLRAGDIILAVDGAAVDGKTLDQVVSSIRGKAGTTVTLSVGRTGTSPFDLSIVRADITVPAVSWAMVPGTTVADIRIEEFSKGASDGVKGALLEAKTAGATSVVLDLRDNPGGYVDEAIGVASVFISSGTVYQERDAKGVTRAIPVQSGNTVTNLPLAVLVNLGSASASEIVSGALQDAGRAEVYGQTTFGTGTVLNEFDLPDGSALLVGTVEWLTPSGREIWHHGITPNHLVALPTTAHELTPEEMQSGGATAVTSADDAQLKAAVDALTGK